MHLASASLRDVALFAGGFDGLPPSGEACDLFFWFPRPDFGLFLYCFAARLAHANTGASDVVDIFNVTDGTWTAAKLSIPRDSLAATTLPDQGLALFAGGHGLDGTLLSFQSRTLFVFHNA
jgi:hypothetical protein